MKGQSDVLVLGLGEMPLKFSSLDLVKSGSQRKVL